MEKNTQKTITTLWKGVKIIESFIVRVYRRSRTKPGEMAGSVETVGSDDKKAFQSVAGLITALKRMVWHGEANAVNLVELDSYIPPAKKTGGLIDQIIDKRVKYIKLLSVRTH